MIRTQWARNTFDWVLQYEDLADAEMWESIKAWEERYLMAKLLVGDDKLTRQTRSQATAGVKDAAKAMGTTIRMRALLKHTGGTCYLCGNPLSSHQADWDRVFPRSCQKGKATVTSGNVMPSHPRCNVNKGDRVPTPEEVDTARDAYAAAGLRFFDQDPAAFYRDGDRTHDFSHPFLAFLDASKVMA